MGEVFEVEPSPSRLIVDKEGKGRVHFRVRNASDHEVQMQAQIHPEKRAEASWFAVDGQAARTLAKGGAATVVVDVRVPPGTKPGDDYGVALELADASSPSMRPERGPGVTMDVNRPNEPHGRGFASTLVGAIVGGIVGFLVALVLGGYEIGHGISRGLSSGWTIGHTISHIVASLFLGLVITVLGALVVPWLGEVLGSGIALRVRRHWGISHTMVVLAILAPIWSILAAIVVIFVFKEIPGRQFLLPLVIWLVTLVIVPPFIARFVTVAGRRHAH